MLTAVIRCSLSLAHPQFQHVGPGIVAADIVFHAAGRHFLHVKVGVQHALAVSFPSDAK